MSAVERPLTPRQMPRPTAGDPAHAVGPIDTDIPIDALDADEGWADAAGKSTGPPGSRRIRRDLAIVAAVAVVTFSVCAIFEVNEALIEWTRPLEPYQLDELPFALIAIAIAFAWFWWRRSREAMIELSRRVSIQTELDRSHRQYRRLSHRYMAMQEAERRGLARELHDELGQTLNAIKIDAVTIRERTRDELPAVHGSALAIVELVDHVYRVVRQMMGRLRPTALDELGLVAAIQHLVDHWRQRLPAVNIELVVSGEVDHAPEDVNIALFRIVQECLTNAARHADARRVRITLRRPASRGPLRLRVEDDGRGFDPGRRASGLGLVGMHERVAAVDGRLRVRSAPGAGTTIEVSVRCGPPPAASAGTSP